MGCCSCKARKTGLKRQLESVGSRLPIWALAHPTCRLHREAPMSEPWLSADQVAAHLGVTKDTVYAWIAEKRMPAHKVGRLWKFQIDEVDEWVRSEGTSSGTDEGR